jgi:hypothetical protein
LTGALALSTIPRGTSVCRKGTEPMTIQGRSLDDLPLAAYTTGVKPDPRLDEPEVAAPSPEPPMGGVSPVDAAAMAALPLADGEPDHSGKAGNVRIAVGRPLPALPGLPAVPEWLAHPRQHLREPRLLLSGLIGVGLVLLLLSLLLGGGAAGGLGAANPSPSAPVVLVTAPPPPGNASVEITTAKFAGTHDLTGSTGSGPAVASQLDATWASATGATLGLRGRASPGTRTTDATFVLTWTLLIDGKPVTFTSDAGECTVGMAVQPKSVTGSFVCRKLKSDDGKRIVDARGTYRT